MRQAKWWSGQNLWECHGGDIIRVLYSGEFPTSDIATAIKVPMLKVGLAACYGEKIGAIKSRWKTVMSKRGRRQSKTVYYLPPREG